MTAARATSYIASKRAVSMHCGAVSELSGGERAAIVVDAQNTASIVANLCGRDPNRPSCDTVQVALVGLIWVELVRRYRFLLCFRPRQSAAYGWAGGHLSSTPHNPPPPVTRIWDRQKTEGNQVQRKVKEISPVFCCSMRFVPTPHPAMTLGLAERKNAIQRIYCSFRPRFTNVTTPIMGQNGCK